MFTSFLGLEVEVLQGLGSLAVEPSRGCVLALARGEVALCHPRGGAMARRFELLCACLGGAQGLLRLVEPSLLEQRATENQLGRSDVEQKVFTAVEELERVPRFLLCCLDLPRRQVHV